MNSGIVGERSIGLPGNRIGLLVVAWLADRREKGATTGLHRLVERLERDAREHLHEDWHTVHTPVEVVEYFAGADAATWSFDRQLFTALGTLGDALLRRTEPRHFLALVERFTTDRHDSSPTDEDVLRFIGRYPGQRGHARETPDLATALAALRGLLG